MLEKTRALIIGVMLLATISAAVLTFQSVRYGIVPPAAHETTSKMPPPPVPAPWLARLAAPRAVLALDISGSMSQGARASDPDRLQTVAALAFYDTYLKLSREVLDRGDVGRIAIVLFGTVAQVIDWGKADGTFLAVTDTNRAVFEGAITRYLGSPAGARAGEPDPRMSRDTDHAAALEVIMRLVTGSPSPPAVVFMTDGKPDPHPCFSPLPLAVGDPRCRGIPQAAPTLSALSLPAAFDRLAGSRPVQRVPVADQALVMRGISERVQALGALRFPLRRSGRSGVAEVPLAWFPIFLDAHDADEDAQAISALTGNAEGRDYWGAGGVVRCHAASDLVSQYVSALAHWLRLVDLDLGPGASRVLVPEQTQSFAIRLETATPVATVSIVHGDRKIALHGYGRHWGEVVSDSCAGEWCLECPGGSITSGHLFLRPRYDWVLSVPAICVEDTAAEAPQAHLYVCRMEDGSVADGAALFPGLPRTLTGQLVLEDGSVRNVVFEESASTGMAPMPTYVASLPLAQACEGPAEVRVDLVALQRQLVPLREDSLSRVFEIASGARLVVRDGRDRRLGAIRFENVPTAPRIGMRNRGQVP